MGLDDRFGSDFLGLAEASPSLLQVAPRIVSKLIGQGDVHLPTDVLRQHVLGQGLFGSEGRGMTGQLWEPAEAKELSLSFARELREQLLQGVLVQRLVTAQPLFLLLNTDVWDAGCTEVFARSLTTPEVLDRFVTSSFWGSTTLSNGAIDKLVGLGKFRSLVDHRMQMPSFDQLPALAKDAYRKVARSVPVVGNNPDDSRRSE
jgi:hypothetical protein